MTSKSDILKRWVEFDEDLYYDDSTDTTIDDSRQEPIPPILKSEIVYAIDNLKPGNSPGLDNVYS